MQRQEPSTINHWKMTAIGMAIVIVTAIATGLVVASWSGRSEDVQPAAMPAPVAELPPRAAVVSETPAVAEPAPAPPRAVASTPPTSVTEACNQQAARTSGAALTTKEKTIEVVKDAAIGVVGGAAVGAVGGAIADGGKGAGKGAAIGGLVGGGAGTLYGIYANKKNDEKYRAAYASCMKSKGYTA